LTGGDLVLPVADLLTLVHQMHLFQLCLPVLSFSIRTSLAPMLQPMSVCVCLTTLVINISETKRFASSCTTGTLLECAYGASTGDVIDDVTWLYDVILVTSHSETRTVSAQTLVEHCVNNHLTYQLRTLGEKHCGVSENCQLIGAVAVQWRRVGHLKLSGVRASSSTSLLKVN